MTIMHEFCDELFPRYTMKSEEIPEATASAKRVIMAIAAPMKFQFPDGNQSRGSTSKKAR